VEEDPSARRGHHEEQHRRFKCNLLYSFDVLCVAVKGDDLEGKCNNVFFTIMFFSIFSDWVGHSAF